MIISRRNFIKAGLASMTTLHPLKAINPFNTLEKIPHANHFGPFYGIVESGILKGIEPQKSDANPSVMIEAIIDSLYSNLRIKSPCVRKSFLENNPDHKTLRGRDVFVEVSWDTALSLVAKKLIETPKENIYNANGDQFDFAGNFHHKNLLSQRFFNLVVGGCICSSGSIYHSVATSLNPQIIGDSEIYSQQTTHEQIIANCKTYVLWGTDLFKGNRVDAVIPNHLNDAYYLQYKKAGIKFICIDPVYTETAQMFEAEWIKIRPNTDVALMLGMMYHLYKSKKYNKTFIQKYTDGFEKFLPYLMGKIDKKAKTPEWAEKITEIPAKKIKELAETFASTRTFIAGNTALQRSHHGDQTSWALITLASMLGHIGLSGGGIGFSMHHFGGGQAKSPLLLPPQISVGENPIKLQIPASRLSDAILNPNKTIDYQDTKITYPKIDVLYLCGSSLIGSEPNSNQLISALRTLDTFIVQDSWWNPSAKMADIILPTTTSLEHDDITYGGFYSRNIIYASKKVIEPLFNSKDDFEIFNLLAEKIGDRETLTRFNEGKTPFEWIQEFYEKSDATSFKDFDQFWKDGFVEFKIPKESYDYVRHSDFRESPTKNKLLTESGKIQIFSPKIASYNLSDFKAHPYWFEPEEWLGSTKSQVYPFHLIVSHPRYRFHQELDFTWIRNLYKIQGREPILINTKDADKLHIQHGEVIEVFNNRGRILAGAYVTQYIRQGVVAIQEGAWYDPENPKEDFPRCNAGDAQVLTSSKPTSSMTQAITSNSTLVALRKLDKDEVVLPNYSILPPKIINQQT